MDEESGKPPIEASRVTAPFLGGDAIEGAPPEVPADRYEVRGEIARGGMGRILEAFDRTTDRRVALKMLLRGSRGSNARLEREARITARLEHPSIVPVHDIGRSPSGDPFFAMKLVSGRSLRAVARDAKSTRERLALLPNLVAVADAIAYAHERGIVHRDLKPSNVLVGAFGETVVIDWGLAKEQEAPASSSTEAEGQAGAGLTVAGHAMGTASYMPPEQARGEPVDARADVYSLGAMMYDVLVGAPPYEGDSAEATIEKLLEGPPPPITTRVPELPADLATVVTKAMARDRDARYPSARELAAELTRFTTGKLVAAHEYSLGALLVRWVRRHAATIAAAALLLVALAIVSVVAVRRVVAERDRADRERTIADHARTIATGQRDAAEKLVAYVIDVLKERLEPLGKLDLLSGVGAEIDRYYDALVESGVDEGAAALTRRLRAIEALGAVEVAKHDAVAARSLFEHAIAIGDRARALDPTLADAAYAVALGHFGLSGIATDEGRFDDAEREAEAAITPSAGEADGDPRSRPLRTMAALATARLAYARFRRGDWAGAHRLLDDASKRIEAISAEDPGDVAAQSARGKIFLQVGDLVEQNGDFAESARALSTSIDAFKSLLAKSPGHAAYLLDLARASYNVSALELRRGDLDAADRAAREAIRAAEKVAERDPDNMEAEMWVGGAHQSLCRSWRARGVMMMAAMECKRAVDSALAVVAAKPGDAGARESLALTYVRKGSIHYEIGGQAAVAAKDFEASVAILTKLVADAPSQSYLRGMLALARRNLALAKLDTKDLPGARAEAAEALELARARHAAARDEATETEVGDCLDTRGQVEAAADAGASERYFREAIERYRHALATLARPSWTVNVAEYTEHLARLVLRDPRRAAEGRRLLEDAASAMAELDAKGTISEPQRHWLARLRGDIAKIAR